MEERWIPIKEFPIYAISNYGTVVNESTGRVMRQNRTQDGSLKVGLVKNGVQYQRSVKVLVADGFVHGRDAIFDTAIQLDNNHDNVRADNLAWRPRWFAHEYCKQFKVESDNNHIGPLLELESADIYKDVYEAAITHGFLFKDVRKSIFMKETVFPSFLRFQLL